MTVTTILGVLLTVKSYFVNEMVAILYMVAIFFGRIDRLLRIEQRYIFKICFIVFLDPENPIMNTRINAVDTIDVELCAKMYVAANGGQYGRHLGNVASYGITK